MAGFSRDDQRIQGLDALRGIAAVGVAIGHYDLYLGTKPLAWLLAPFYNGYGFLVEFFFVLSGFLLTKVYAPTIGFRGLVVRRLARLFPLHWLTLGLVALGQVAFAESYGRPFVYTDNDVWNFILNLLLLQQVGLQSGFSFNGPSWSISAEWVVNLLFFWLLTRPDWLVPAALALAVSAGVVIWITQPELTAFGLAFGFLDTGVLRAALGFFLGVLLAKCDGRLLRDRSEGQFWDVASLGAVCIFVCFLANRDLNSIRWIQFLAVCTVMPFLVLSCSRGRLAGAILSWRPLTWLGDISYAVYLIHFPLQMVVRGLRQYFPLQLNSGEGLILFLAVLCGAAHVTYQWFERPAQRWLRRTLQPWIGNAA